MRESAVSFDSEGDRLDAVFRQPEDAKPRGGIVHGPGFLGLKRYSGYRRFHEAFTDAGFAVLAFDYRGFGESGGEALMLPSRQLEDLRNAVTYLKHHEAVPAGCIGAFGTGGTGGANAVALAGTDDRIACTVARNTVADGAEWLRGMRREYEWLELLDALEEDRRQRVLTGESQLVDARGDNGLQIPTPERREAAKVDEVDPDIPTQLPLRCAEAIAAYRPIDVVGDAVGPILFVCVEDDDTTPMRHAEALYRRAPRPKRMLVQTNTTHYESMDRNFEAVSAAAVDWYDRHLSGENSIQIRSE